MGNVRVRLPGTALSHWNRSWLHGLKETETHSYRYTRTAALPLRTVIDLAWSTSYPRIPPALFSGGSRDPPAFTLYLGVEMRGGLSPGTVQDSPTLSRCGLPVQPPMLTAVECPTHNCACTGMSSPRARVRDLHPDLASTP